MSSGWACNDTTGASWMSSQISRTGEISLSHPGHQSVLAKAFIFLYFRALTSCGLADPEGTDLPVGLVNS